MILLALLIWLAALYGVVCNITLAIRWWKLPKRWNHQPQWWVRVWLIGWTAFLQGIVIAIFGSTALTLGGAISISMVGGSIALFSTFIWIAAKLLYDIDNGNLNIGRSESDDSVW